MPTTMSRPWFGDALVTPRRAPAVARGPRRRDRAQQGHGERPGGSVQPLVEGRGEHVVRERGRHDGECPGHDDAGRGEHPSRQGARGPV